MAYPERPQPSPSKTSNPDASNDDLAWDAFLAGHAFGHHEQSSAYARLRAAYGFGSDRILLRSHGRVVGGAQFLLQRTPVGTFARIQRGPLALNDDPGLLKTVVAAIIEHCERQHYVSVRIDTFSAQLRARQSLVDAGFEVSTDWCDRHVSYVIPLTLSEDELLPRMHYNVRRYVRRARTKHNIRIRSGCDDSFEDFYGLHRKTAEHQAFPTFPRSYFQYVREMLQPVGRAMHFVGYVDDAPVAAVFNCAVGDTMYYGWGGMDRGESSRRLHAYYPVHLAAAEWARQAGYKCYDLCGNQFFKRPLAIDEIDWPCPLRRLFGPVRGIRKALMKATWEWPLATRLTRRLARQLGLPSQLPW